MSGAAAGMPSFDCGDCGFAGALAAAAGWCCLPPRALVAEICTCLSPPPPLDTISAAITAAAATSGLAATATRRNALTRLAFETFAGFGNEGFGTPQAASGRSGRATSSSASSAGPGTASLSASSAMPRARRRGISAVSTPSAPATFSSEIARRSDRSSRARVPESSSCTAWIKRGSVLAIGRARGGSAGIGSRTGLLGDLMSGPGGKPSPVRVPLRRWRRYQRKKRGTLLATFRRHGRPARDDPPGALARAGGGARRPPARGRSHGRGVRGEPPRGGAPRAARPDPVGGSRAGRGATARLLLPRGRALSACRGGVPRRRLRRLLASPGASWPGPARAVRSSPRAPKWLSTAAFRTSSPPSSAEKSNSRPAFVVFVVAGRSGARPPDQETRKPMEPSTASDTGELQQERRPGHARRSRGLRNGARVTPTS